MEEKLLSDVDVPGVTDVAELPDVPEEVPGGRQGEGGGADVGSGGAIDGRSSSSSSSASLS